MPAFFCAIRAAALAACALPWLYLLGGCGSREGQLRPGGPAPIPFERFEAADANHDGKLDRGEAAVALPPGLVENFDHIDSDRSGYLSWSELRAARYPPPRPLPPIRSDHAESLVL